MAAVPESVAGLIYRQGVRYRGTLDSATVKEIAMFASDQTIGAPNAEAYEFTATGMLYGVSTTRQLRRLAAKAVTGTITLQSIDHYSHSHSVYHGPFGAAINLEGLATYTFDDLQTYAKYRPLIDEMLPDGYIHVEYLSTEEQLTSYFDLSTDFIQSRDEV
ncbi:MAG: hypothetical protein QFB87_04770 [Patescibacteria group bacterium]|nr:hypothetical protein [Patescibacteria group bacterium]